MAEADLYSWALLLEVSGDKWFECPTHSGSSLSTFITTASLKELLRDSFLLGAGEDVLDLKDLSRCSSRPFVVVWCSRLDPLPCGEMMAGGGVFPPMEIRRPSSNAARLAASIIMLFCLVNPLLLLPPVSSEGARLILLMVD